MNWDEYFYIVYSVNVYKISFLKYSPKTNNLSHSLRVAYFFIMTTYFFLVEFINIIRPFSIARPSENKQIAGVSRFNRNLVDKDYRIEERL